MGRLVEFKGTFNFRDIGGYKLEDGQEIQPGLLYRSDHLSDMTRADWRKFSRLHIRTIIDLRGEPERRRHPSRYPPGLTPTLHNLALYDPEINYDEIHKRLLTGKMPDQELVDLLSRGYRQYITDFAEVWRQLFQILLQPEYYPILIHCNGGKDRTGVVIALIMTALGVPYATLLQDYLDSKKLLQKRIDRSILKLRLLSLFRVKRGQVQTLIDARESFLRITFDAIDERYGSPQQFFDQLGLDLNARARLKMLLCGF